MGMKKYSHHINRNTTQHKKLWVPIHRNSKKSSKKDKEKKEIDGCVTPFLVLSDLLIEVVDCVRV
jgi:hypothetical protein